MRSYTNPVLPGFYSDPSVCRCGDTFYMVHSSMEYFPGVPLFQSKDMVHWTQLGHVLTRASQLDLDGAWSSGGIYAPTIRFHDGMFYMTTTNASHGGNLIVHTKDPAGPWSEPVFVAQKGIDPSLFFDDDGKVYFTSVGYEGHRQGIQMCEIDPMSGQCLTESRIIWFGTGGRYPEGSHLYKHDGLYYLMIAEGGTEFAHMETVARSTSPWGPFEGCPDNPILTNRDENMPYLCGVGHADLVEDGEDGGWMVFHGFRLSQTFFHRLGRETCVVPFRWENGWPKPVTGRVAPQVVSLDAEEPENMLAAWAVVEDDLQQYAPRWCFLRNPYEENYRFAKDGLHLTGGCPLSDRNSPSIYLLRQKHFDVTASVHMDVEQLGEGGFCGISTFYNDEAHYDFGVAMEKGQRRLKLVKHVGDIDFVAYDQPCGENALELVVRSTKKEYAFLTRAADGTETLCGMGLTRLVSTEATSISFTGIFLGLFAVADCKARFTHFHYQAQKEE